MNVVEARKTAPIFFFTFIFFRESGREPGVGHLSLRSETVRTPWMAGLLRVFGYYLRNMVFRGIQACQKPL